MTHIHTSNSLTAVTLGGAYDGSRAYPLGSSLAAAAATYA